MNSKGIQPRVGMQFVFSNNGVRRKISRIVGRAVICNGYDNCCGDLECACTSTILWESGAYEIEWIPPTDEERVMFANAAKQLRDRNRQYNLSEEARFIWCVPSLHDDMEFELGESADASLEIASSIAESLALDGMDIDDVSKIEELMK